MKQICIVYCTTKGDKLKICFFIISEYALIIEKQYPFIFLFHTILQFKLDKAMLAFYLAFEI